MTTIKEDDVEDHFSTWSGMTCNKCGETIANDYGDLVEHLSGHDIEVEKN